MAERSTHPGAIRLVAPGELLRELEARAAGPPPRVRTAAPANRRRSRRSLALVFGTIASMLMTAGAFAIIGNLTTESSVVKIDEAIYRSYDETDPTGSGVFDTFLRISSANSPVIQGYNTDGRPLQFDENSSPQHTRSYRLSNVPLVSDPDYAGSYREFQLDINQTSGNAIYSLDNVEVYLTVTPDILGYPFTSGTGANQADKVYELDKVGDDTSGDNSIEMNYSLAEGSGKRDLILRIPNANFLASDLGDDPACAFAGSPPAGSSCNTYVVLYSHFGEDIAGLAGNDDGYEEWGVKLYDLASKSGTKFEDLNANGVFDAGEPGLPGWTIYVDYNDNGALDTGEPFAITDENGDYELAVMPGTWKIREVGQAGWTCSLPTTSDAYGCYYEETFAQGESYLHNDFGNWTPATKSGVKFEDLDADGQPREAGEPGLGGWTIYVDYNGNSSLDAGEPYDVTASDGSYTIEDITPGTYNVREVGQSGWTCSYPSPCYHNETFVSGDTLTGNDFGNWTPATKSGYKFIDNDQDGNYEPGDPQNDVKVGGWIVELWKLNGSTWEVVASTTTDATIGYEFSGLMPGVTYAVCETTMPNFYQSFPYSGATLPAGESVFDCTQLTPDTPLATFAPYGYTFEATSGAIFDANRFGNYYVPPGCTLTPGYWKTHSTYGPAAHPDDTWYELSALGPDTPFFDSGDTWYEVFWTQPKGGNAWYILAHQYMAAELNLLNDAGSVPGLADALSDAEAILDKWDGSENIPKKNPDRQEAIDLAMFLDDYNNGLLGVPHCGEPGYAGPTFV